MPQRLLKDRRNLRSRAERALRERFKPPQGQELDDKGRLTELRPLLSPEITDAELAAACSDIAKGSGGELRPTRKKDGTYRPPPLHSVYGSCSLALNCFAPWRLNPTGLTINGHTGFTHARLEVKLPIRGIQEGEPPNLDVGLAGEDCALVIESKLTEHLAPNHVASFQEKYRAAIPYADPTWKTFYDELLGEADKKLARQFQYLHVGQLVRHYLGLASQLVEGGIYEGRRGTLLYLYWEPDDADSLLACRVHRDEVAAVQAAVSDPNIPFEALSYRNLWRSWALANEPRVQRHARYLEERYGVSLAAD